jgi:uncharacterized protein YcbK (DUF882 family)
MNHFASEEQTCGCGCGLNLIERNPDFLRALNSARELYGDEMNATSMTRCPEHNAAVGGAPHSAHLDGRAADISCTGLKNRMDMIRAFIACGFHRIEVSPVHIHVDMKKGAHDAFMLKIGETIV